jgi:HAD superfamily hydrolase (TIGR01549 family)
MTVFKQIFLDFDGVIADTNTLKKQNIMAALLNYIDESDANKFVTYFIANNGIPREKKIFAYFSDKALALKILNSYNSLNKNLIDAMLIEGLVEFLNKNKHIPIFILSGGDRLEIEDFLLCKSIRKYFTEILCGPKTKEENLELFDLKRPALYIGDSAHDYELAKKFYLEFIFLYGTSQEVEWSDKKFPDASFFKNFNEF